ncbi:MAPEG family protein [Dokdonella sp.]|uniref:MAPEG family protein n=1 Tax=Dokdonella sp. TaxID=2291710 RepID=UPI0031C825EB|nr:MAPEG family protein [Dokdonella sp.]
MHVTAIYAALATLLVLVLAARVSLGRYGAKVSLGDGGDRELTRRIRVHANALENLPLALILLLLLDLAQFPVAWLHTCGIVLIVARVLHAVGLSRADGPSFGRSVGTALTWGVMLVMAILLLAGVVMRSAV